MSVHGKNWQHTLGVRRRRRNLLAAQGGGDSVDCSSQDDTVDQITEAMEGDDQLMSEEMAGNVKRRFDILYIIITSML